MVENRNHFRLLRIGVILFLCMMLSSCGPSIKSFIVEPRSISSDDSVRINWDVSGTPTLLVKEQKVIDDSGHFQIDTRYVNYTLVVEKGGKEEHQSIQVTVYPKVFTNEIIIETTSRSGDTIIAKDIKDPERWGKLYEVLNVSSKSERELYIVHGGKVTTINADGSPSIELKGTPIEGDWEIRTLLTESEKNDIATAPTSLSLNAVIQYKKR